MGVHGLSGRIKSVIATAKERQEQLVEGSTLCVDGDGLIFELFKLSYREHYKNIITNFAEHPSKQLQSQLLLPMFTPLSLIHKMTTSYLQNLTLKHGMHLQIYFDGTDQFMKHRQRLRRRDRRNDEWENTRQLCIHGILPEIEAGQSRSAARRQARAHRNSSEDPTSDDDDVDFFLSSFPYSPLAFLQVKRSIREFANVSSVLFRGSIQLINCKGEADVNVARASSLNQSAYALANDTDYLIYGTEDEEKVVKYVMFNQINPSDEELFGTILTRSEVSNNIGLFCAQAMIEVSILLGNDYTGPLLRHGESKKQKEYWASLRWQRGGEEIDTLPNLDNEIQPIIDHVGGRVIDGWTLTSVIEELHLAIEYSYALYTFRNTESFRSRAHDDVGGEEIESMAPNLPPGFDEYIARAPIDANKDIHESATAPLTLYMSEAAVDTDYCVEQKHLDALKSTAEALTLQSSTMELPRHHIHWKDVQAIFILEKLLSRVINGIGGAEAMPYRVFDHLLFLSYLQSISFEDFSLNDVPTSRGDEDVAHNFSRDYSSKKLVLPIDKYRKEILSTIKQQRVTIIHGETGCGKSSRVPCFLLRADPPEPSLAAPEVKMVISQPRRIAAKALAERVRKVEKDLSNKVALRMGHGIKEFETSQTRAWFVTTGYVVRLLANHPHWFDSHTHLIIDEVHERSVDSDILCLLCRRLLHNHPTIRLVLMSATLAAELYSQYFGSPPPIHVGVRRFPINEYFVEDLESQLSLSRKHAQYAQDIYDECKKNRCKSAPPDAIKDKMYHLASQIAASVGQHGSSVLIFVAGMSDIESITELIEKINIRGVTFTCFPIHSEVPFDEQMEAFELPKEGEVKVVIATNAAESSVTLPDVDHVICLGLCKQIVYNKASHRQQLIPTWISRASATQRAGRTGRVRIGNVYRLYSRVAYDEYFDAFEAGEILRTPLDSVILNLRDMLREPVTEILQDCIEAPDITTIERSFQSLHASNFISLPSDEGEITSLGELVVALGIDLKLGALVGMGVQFGVAAESIELAAILSSQRTPWAISSPMYHDTDTFNTIVSTTFTSRCYYDAGLFSEPMGVSNLLFDYRNSQKKDQFCWTNRLSGVRMRHLNSTVKSLRSRVAERLEVAQADLLEMDCPFYDMNISKINILRIIQVWLFNDTMMVQQPKYPCNDDKSVSIPIEGAPIQRSHLEQILDPSVDFQIENRGKIVQQGNFDSSDEDNYIATFRIRFMSYMIEKEVDLSFYSVGKCIEIFVPTKVWEGCQLLRKAIIGMFGAKIETITVRGTTGTGNQRGVRGRACGAWYPDSETIDTNVPKTSVTILSSTVSKQDLSLFQKEAEIICSNAKLSVRSVISIEIKKEIKNKIPFIITSFGECHEIGKIDMCDLFASNAQSTALKERMKQIVTFTYTSDNSTDVCPLIEDAPEGARLLSVLASERRRDNFIRLSSDEYEIDVDIPRSLSVNGKGGWKRKDGQGKIYVIENSVCSAVLPLDTSKEVFGCAANTLDLRGGACKVEGVTLCPPGRLFCGLALLSFGINPRTSTAISVPKCSNDEDSIEEKKDGIVENIIQDALSWIRFKNGSEDLDEWRVREALRFHMHCMEQLDETLDCRPDEIRTLCALFDGVGGNHMGTWEGYDLNFTEASASRRPKYKKRVVPRKAEHKSQPTESSKVFGCPGCNETYNCVELCTEHMQSCCFGLVRNQDPIIKSR